MHEEVRPSATAFDTLDFRCTKSNLRVVGPNENGRRPAGVVIPYRRKFSAFYHARTERGQRLVGLEAENAELRDQAVDLALAIMDLKDMMGR